MNKCFITYIRCDVKTMCYIVFISHSLHWRYIKIALRKYVINADICHTSEITYSCPSKLRGLSL